MAQLVGSLPVVDALHRALNAASHFIFSSEASKALREVLSDPIKYAHLQDAVRALPAFPKTGNVIDLLNWILANWSAIWAIIQQLIHPAPTPTPTPAA